MHVQFVGAIGESPLESRESLSVCVSDQPKMDTGFIFYFLELVSLEIFAAKFALEKKKKFLKMIYLMNRKNVK